MWLWLGKLVLRYLIEPWWSPLYQKAGKKLLIWIRISPTEDGDKSGVDYIEKILWEFTKARRPRKKTLKRIYSWKENNIMRLPILVECLKRQRNLGKLSNALELLASDQRVNLSVKGLPSPSLHQWIEAFCYFCTIFNSDKSFKKKNDSNLKYICRSSLFLLDSAILEFSSIEPIHQEQLCKSILSTYITILEKMKNNWQDLMPDHLPRLIERVPALLKNIKIDDELNILVKDFSELIPPALEAAMCSHLVRFAPILDGICEKNDEICDILKIWNYLAPHQGCLFLSNVIQHTIGSRVYLGLANTHKSDAIKIASAINSLLSQCSVICPRNTTNHVCDGSARSLLRGWMYLYTSDLIRCNLKAHEELCRAIISIEKKTNPNRDYIQANRAFVDSAGEIFNNDSSLKGTVRHISEDEALFACEKDGPNESDQLFTRTDNRLSFTVNSKHIVKPIRQIIHYEPISISQPPQRVVRLFSVKFADKLPPADFNLCKKHANGVLV